MTSALYAALGRGDDIAKRVVEAFDMLLREGIDRESPHAFPVALRRSVDGQIKETRIFPIIWLRRLDRAVEGGVFERRSPQQIVTTILTTEPPAELLGDEHAHSF